MTNASPVMLQSTCARDAPSARSIANSRRRCATVIEKALKMMNAPTSTAMPPKLSSTGRRNAPMASLSALVWSAAACAPVLTSAYAGSAARTRFASVSAETPASAFTSISDRRPSMPNQLCASASVVWMSSDPPRDDCAANLNTPDTVASCAPSPVITVIGEPGLSFLSWASFWMTATSPDCSGGRPAMYCGGAMSLGEYEKKSVGEPPVSTTLPSTATAPMPAT